MAGNGVNRRDNPGRHVAPDRPSAPGRRATVATDDEVMRGIDGNGRFGTGIGYIDAHLRSAVRLTPGSPMGTRDDHLLAASTRLGLDYVLPR